MKTVIRTTGSQHTELFEHLFPGDGLEAVAIGICGHHLTTERHILTLKEIYKFPHEHCIVRTPFRVTWPTENIVPIIEKASRTDSVLIKIHSHPNGLEVFSETDNEADRKLFQSLNGWFDKDFPHASCIMLPDGKMFGRIVKPDGQFEEVSTIAVAGENVYFWNSSKDENNIPEFARRHAQAFGSGTFDVLRKLSIAVVGCSGTGSPVVEQLARFGAGRLVIVDPDIVEEKNLNRIINTFGIDAERREFKVNVLAEAVKKMGTGTEVVALPLNLYDPEVVKRVSECDIIFGCMDSVDGRHLLNRLATFYNIPYIDIGIKLIADGQGGVEQICGSVHYLQPDKSSLMSRGVYSVERLYAETLKRKNPSEYDKQVREKYIVGVKEDRPAVISVNMQFAAMAVNEFLARIHQFREDGNQRFAVTRMSLTQAETYYEPEGKPCSALSKNAGRGDVVPLLDMPELSEINALTKGAGK